MVASDSEIYSQNDYFGGGGQGAGGFPQKNKENEKIGEKRVRW